MADADLGSPKQPSARSSNRVLSGLALSSAALLAVLLNEVSTGVDAILGLFGSAIAAVFGLAAALSYVRLAGCYPETPPAGLQALGVFLGKWKDSRWASASGAIASCTSGICYWVLPGVWLTLAASVATTLLRQIWPAVFSYDNPLVHLLPAVLLAIALYAGRGRGAAITAGVMGVVGVIQIAAAVVASVLILGHHPPQSKKTDAAWTLDSNGNATQWVQDSTPDPSRTLPDSLDPTRQIPDPSATIPKVDAAGKPIWVYNAVDAQGNVLLDSKGDPIVVPTDASGNPGTPPAGAVRAEPAQNLPMPPGQASFKFHPIPTSVRYDVAGGCMAMMCLVVFQFLAALGQERIRIRIMIFGLLVTLLIQGSALTSCCAPTLLRFFSPTRKLEARRPRPRLATG